MEQSVINERIKELQNDSKFAFKLTEDVIDIVYRTAIKDLINEISNNVVEKVEIQTNDKDADDVIFTTKSSDNYEQLYDNVIVENGQLQKTINSLYKEIDELKKKNKSLPKKSSLNVDEKIDNEFQSGLVTGLKYAMMSMEGHNIEEAWKLVLDKYNSVMRPKDKYSNANARYNRY